MKAKTLKTNDKHKYNVCSVMGLDLSLKNIGLVIFDFTGKDILSQVYMPLSKEEDRGKVVIDDMAWFGRIRDKMRELFHSARPIVFLEDYAFSKKTSVLTRMAESGGLVKMVAYELGIPVFLVPSSTWKCFLFGKKEKDDVKKDYEMVPMEVLSKYGYKAQATHDADAYMLGQIGMAYLRLKYPGIMDNNANYTQYQKERAEKIEKI